MGEPLDLRLRFFGKFVETERVETFIPLLGKLRLVLTGEWKDEYLDISQDVWRRPIHTNRLQAWTSLKPSQRGTFYSRTYSNDMFGTLATGALQLKVEKTFLGLEAGVIEFHEPDGSTDNRFYAGGRFDF